MALQVQRYTQPHPVERCAGEFEARVRCPLLDLQPVPGLPDPVPGVCRVLPDVSVPPGGLRRAHALAAPADRLANLANAPERADYRDAFDYLALQFQEYDILLRHEPEAADSTTVPCIMPTWRDPTFRLSDRQRR
ncbi:hypothetical protein PBRA_002345 [Plasmodiophora brassicae]|uniref:Uncharacterized protein n=1 Tax=Plasmodiophora brassicae TaxID=37360 RepID=A0A0G4J3B9_PLABS|nr:hypothetical protein PBRA_002345 [Plasmodiophora brassicae]